MIKKILSFSRPLKQIIMLFADSLVLIVILIVSFSIRLGYLWWPTGDYIWIVYGAPVTA